MENETLRDWHYIIKMAFMTVFIFGDMFVNSNAEYEALQVNDTPPDTQSVLLSAYENTDYERMSQLQIILFGCSILLQASIFSAFFLILVDTWPFQIGLIGVIWSQFKYMLIAQGWYSIATFIVGAMRLNQVFSGNTDIWKDPFYIIISCFHKLVAPCYYAVTLRSALRLDNEMYYTKDAWISSGSVLSDEA